MLSTFTPASPLLLVGYGNMGRAMVDGWLRAGLDAAALHVIDPVFATAPAGELVAHTYAAASEVPEITPRALMVAVKPQAMEHVLPGLARFVGDETLALSIAAGVKISTFAEALGDDCAIVRTMPNTPAAIGEGVSGLCASAGVTDEDKALAEALMAAAGQTVWVADEALMNSVTAVSGSGPAYVFHFVEALAVAAEREGFDPETAMALARQTVIGAAALMKEQGDVPAATLRERVTSPGGTTAAALGVLMPEAGLTGLLARAVEAARKRGEELGG